MATMVELDSGNAARGRSSPNERGVDAFSCVDLRARCRLPLLGPTAAGDSARQRSQEHSLGHGRRRRRSSQGDHRHGRRVHRRTAVGPSFPPARGLTALSARFVDGATGALKRDKQSRGGDSPPRSVARDFGTQSDSARGRARLSFWGWRQIHPPPRARERASRSPPSTAGEREGGRALKARRPIRSTDAARHVERAEGETLPAAAGTERAARPRESSH